MKIYDESQIQILLNNATEIGDQYYQLYYLAIHTGMRQGELIGLKWSDLNWDNRTLQVKRQVVRYQDGSYAFTKPKSKSGFRTIVIGKQVLNVLQTQNNKIWKLQNKAGLK
jgi:integrase